jgi:hypothetical protein
MTFAELLTAANQSQTKVGRGSGQWTSAAVETWRAAEPEMAGMLDAAIALELKMGRKVTATDEDLVRRMRGEMDAAAAAMKAKQIG